MSCFQDETSSGRRSYSIKAQGSCLKYHTYFHWSEQMFQLPGFVFLVEGQRQSSLLAFLVQGPFPILADTSEFRIFRWMYYDRLLGPSFASR